MYIIGKTNTGESTLIEKLVIVGMKMRMLYRKDFYRDLTEDV